MQESGLRAVESCDYPGRSKGMSPDSGRTKMRVQRDDGVADSSVTLIPIARNRNTGSFMVFLKDADRISLPFFPCKMLPAHTFYFPCASILILFNLITTYLPCDICHVA